MGAGRGTGSAGNLLWPRDHPTGRAREVEGSVLENGRVAPGLWRLRVHVPLPWGPPTPGQFVQLICPDDGCWRLRRPFSLAGWREEDSRGATLEIVYAPVGVETGRMTGLRREAPVGLVGPLGIGFGVVSRRRAVLVGGGRGVAPLLFLGESLAHRRHPALLIYGYKSKELRMPIESPIPLQEASEDGSRGRRGTVVDLLESLFSKGEVDPNGDAIYACGPTSMLVALASWACGKGFLLETSLETYFGCGYGVCAACAVPIQGGSGYGTYAFACREGPVFNAEEVKWGELVD